MSERAQWISGPAYDYGTDDVGYYEAHRNHVLERRFQLSACERAELTVAVLGYARRVDDARGGRERGPEKRW